ncbi:MAG: DegV family protein [Syntrophaceticus sp.]|nr:DegV family protein [Syntrophaceticus sp.]MDD4783522.1 DegV family protein [Syntrophaceticus sp.]
MLQIITDSAADLPPEIVEKYNIHVVPLTVNIDGKEYIDGVDLSPQGFYHKMSTSKNLPKTSQPPVAAFSKVFQELDSKGDLLCINISSKLSGTYQTACLAAKEMSDVDVAVFDSWAAALGQGLQVVKAAGLAEKGLSRAEIIDKLTEYRNNMNILILLDSLENIVKGGRLSKFQGSLAKLLNIKVLLKGVEGAVVMSNRIHGRKKALQRVMEIAIDKVREGKGISTKTFGISHCNNIKDAEFLKEQFMEQYQSCNVIVNDMGTTLATYAGLGGMVISF